MKNATTALLDELQRAFKLPSDYATAKLLEVRQQTLSSYRTGRSQMDDAIACKVADLLKRPRAEVLALLSAERTKSPEAARAWRDVARELGRRAAALLLAVGIGGAIAPPDSQASVLHNRFSGAHSAVQNVSDLHMVRLLLRRARRVRDRLVAGFISIRQALALL